MSGYWLSARPTDVIRNSHLSLEQVSIPESRASASTMTTVLHDIISCFQAMYQAPTRRELALFIALLVFPFNFVSYGGSSHLDLSSAWHDVFLHRPKHTIPTLPSDTRVSWGTSKVPRTKIIAHVPGEHSSSDIDTCTLMSTLSKDGLSLTRCTFTTAPYFLSVTNQEHSPIENSSPRLESSSTMVQKWSEHACLPIMTCA